MEWMQNAIDLPLLTSPQPMGAGRPRSDLLAPWLASDTQALVYGPPGIGKSFLALGIAWAVAQGSNPGSNPGTSFLGWRAPKPRRVLYVDGEMGAAELRDRLALFGPLPGNLAIVPHDRPGGARLDLGTEDGIVRLMAGWNDPQLLVLDTLSALAPAARADRDHERRDALHCLLLHLKQTRRAVLMVDHTAKNGAARRASAADLVMALRPAGGGAAGGNARFEIHFEKTRQRAPLFPILAELQTVDGAGAWRWDAACRVDRLAALVRQGLSRRDVCEALGIERSWFFRLKAEARARGLLPPKGTS